MLADLIRKLTEINGKELDKILSYFKPYIATKDKLLLKEKAVAGKIFFY